ncbi:hypothetical protein B0H16DRAFT_1810320 [Mycena metata]|uniref:Uncharacterized protein n=1 Tax=Mycena metata TaxID=1033252 RepID=A0AAD7H744_9AGAR|nr:hypothetical protein B0H16DRAFT_1810320 [Mycena metata]
MVGPQENHPGCQPQATWWRTVFGMYLTDRGQVVVTWPTIGGVIFTALKTKLDTFSRDLSIAPRLTSAMPVTIAPVRMLVEPCKVDIGQPRLGAWPGYFLKPRRPSASLFYFFDHNKTFLPMAEPSRPAKRSCQELVECPCSKCGPGSEKITQAALKLHADRDRELRLKETLPPANSVSAASYMSRRRNNRGANLFA